MIYREIDVVRLKSEAEAFIRGGPRRVVARPGTIGTIVAVYGAPEQPQAYEIEMYLGDEKDWVLATIRPDMIEPVTSDKN